MSSTIYLVKKGDLYKIGHTKNLAIQMDKILPDEIIDTLQLEDPIPFQARLFKRYKKVRLPETGYFKLTDKQLSDCKKEFKRNTKALNTLKSEFSISATASLLLGFTAIVITSLLKLNIFSCISISLASATMPMWFLFVYGNVGGYDSSDLPPFALWSTRFKALAFSSIVLLISYLTLKINLGLNSIYINN